MVFPHRACASRRRCSHSGISMGLYLVATPRDGWWLSSPSGTAGASPPYRPRLLLEAAVSAALSLGQSQRPVSGADSIRSCNRRVTEPETRSVVDNAPGVQLAAILALDPYSSVVDGHTVGGYRSPPPTAIVKIDERASWKSRLGAIIARGGGAPLPQPGGRRATPRRRCNARCVGKSARRVLLGDHVC